VRQVPRRQSDAASGRGAAAVRPRYLPDLRVKGSLMFVRSEFSLREAFGPMREVVAQLPAWGGVIADWGCWGHVNFVKECEKANRRAVLGTRVRLITALDDKMGRDLIIIPKDGHGLRAMYHAVTLAYQQKYFVPRLLTEQLPDGCHVLDSSQIFTSAGSAYGVRTQYASCDNFFPRIGDRESWALMLGKLARNRPGPMHITSEDELRAEGASEEQILETRRLVESCETPLPKAENIKFGVKDPDKTLRDICWKELAKRGMNKPQIAQRLDYELNLIAEKKFSDYFLVIADMIAFAKQHMLVGPARGSSAGSLVCFLTRITEINPLIHGLIFERFVDVNRMDLPDIDIDFPDEKRHMVMEYLANKYGHTNVAHIGTIIRYKPKSALTDVAKELRIPLWELDKLKDVLIEHSSGDARAEMCLQDSIDQLEVGQQLVKKYPKLKIASRLEAHARAVGKHAAGIIVCNRPVTDYCAITDDATAQLDKKMAEKLNMLKIDALGLRTLTIIEQACELAGIDPFAMYQLPLEDPRVFEVLNARKYAGIFQFEGIALQGVANQIVFDSFRDVAAVTALARPGPLSSGETQKWTQRKAGREEIEYIHPLMEQYTSDQYGCIVYQEQVMRILREVGAFSWADTSVIRKIMSDRQGDEKFAAFESQFIRGAVNNGVPQQQAQKIWKAVNTFGSWAFNKSHAVAYGLVSYWTAWLKAYHPLPLIVANLRNAKDDEGTLSLLREAVNEGIEYIPFDAQESSDNWSIKDGKILGGLLCIPGIGNKTAKDIMVRRSNGIKLTPRQQKLLGGVSKFAEPFPTRARWGHIYADPGSVLNNVERVNFISEIDTGSPNYRWVVIGKLVKKNLRDRNDPKYLVRRNGRRVPEDQRDMLLFNIEDDTGRALCCVSNRHYSKLGKRIVEEASIGQWFAVRGRVTGDFKLLDVDGVRWLDGA
jgi:DNA polymerase III alpha subunit